MERDFPRLPVVRRQMRAEGHLDRFAGQVVIAVVCALTAAIWEGTHQAQTPAHLLVAVSVWKLALAAVIGAVGGLLLVPGSLFTFELVRYPLSRYRDAWEARPGRTMADEVLFELVCKVHPPVEVSTLGYMEFRVKDSSEASLLSSMENWTRTPAKLSPGAS